MLPLVVFTDVTTLSSETMNSSILNLLHMNDPSQLRQHLSKIFTSNLDVNWMHKLHFDRWIFCINIGLKLMLQESLENCRFVYNTLLSCSHRKCALGPTYIVYLRCKQPQIKWLKKIFENPINMILDQLSYAVQPINLSNSRQVKLVIP